jgi:hypothetical protein
VRTSASGTLRVPEPCRGGLRFAFHGRVPAEDYQGPVTHGHGSSAASVAPSRLRGAPLVGSKYGVAGQRGSPAIAGQDPLPQLIGGHPSGRYLGERRQVLRTWLQALGPHRCQRRRDRVLPLGRLLQRFVLLTDTSTPSVLRWAPKPAATQPTPVAVLLLNPVVRVCASRMGSEENQIVCGG